MNEAQVFLDMLKNKDVMVSALLQDLNTCTQNFAAFEKLEKMYADNPESVSAVKALTACSKSLRHMNDLNRRMIMMLVAYAMGDTFSGDTARLLMKMGHGDVALRELFKQKMGGKA